MVEAVADLVGQAEANVKAPVGERELPDLEARGECLGAQLPAEVRGRVARARNEQTGGVAQLE